MSNIKKNRLLGDVLYNLSSMTHYIFSYPLLLLQHSYLEIKSYVFIASNYKIVHLENKKLRESIRYLDLIQQENNELKRLVNFQDNSRFLQITTRAIIASYAIFDTQYLLNVGLKNGVSKGNPVLSCGKMIGSIVSAGEWSSKMRFITQQNSKIPVSIIGTSYNAIAIGQNQSHYLKLSYLPDDASIEDGKVVVTSGEGGHIPYGIYIGKIQNTGNKILVKTCIDCDNDVRFLTVLKLKNYFITSSKR